MKLAWFNKESTREKPQETVLERLDRLEAGFRSMLLEWEDTYERLFRLMARVNKRTRDQADREERLLAEQDAPGPTISPQPGVDPISAAIHARRARAVQTRADGGG